MILRSEALSAPDSCGFFDFFFIWFSLLSAVPAVKQLNHMKKKSGVMQLPDPNADCRSVLEFERLPLVRLREENRVQLLDLQTQAGYLVNDLLYVVDCVGDCLERLDHDSEETKDFFETLRNYGNFRSTAAMPPDSIS